MASEAAGNFGAAVPVAAGYRGGAGGAGGSISYVAERMMVRHNSAVELVDRAEQAGLVRREADASDHRRSLVELTRAGRLRCCYGTG